MKNRELGAFISVISHNRPQNIDKITSLVGDCTFFVNKGEKESYIRGGAKRVIECGDDICDARNKAIKIAFSLKLPCIQVSDDLRYLRKIYFPEGQEKRKVIPATFNEVVKTMLGELKRTGLKYGGIAVTSNRMNYVKDVNFSYDKLIVNDLICIMPDCNFIFDKEMALKEDYDFTLVNILLNKGVVRCNQFFGQFPHRENEGGANEYRSFEAEKKANERLIRKWGDFIKKHPSRENQISLNYSTIKKVLIKNYGVEKFSY